MKQPRRPQHKPITVIRHEADAGGLRCRFCKAALPGLDKKREPNEYVIVTLHGEDDVVDVGNHPPLKVQAKPCLAK